MKRSTAKTTMLTRRQFNRRLLAGLAIASTGVPLPTHPAPRSTSGTAHLGWLQATLPGIDRRFDPFAKMLVAPAADVTGRHGILTTGDVHPTRASLNYAAALLDTGDSERVTRANEILRAIIGLQELDPASETFGHWPLALEEPLANSPIPALDHAAFCAIPLLMAWMLHRERIIPQLREPVREAILSTAVFLQRRDLATEAARVALPISGVMLLAAQEFKQPELRTTAKERLHKLHARVKREGAFAERNNPAGMTVILQELARLLWLVKDARHLELLGELHDLAWRDAATRFHAPTCQWAGPHSHSEETDLRKRPALLALLQKASGQRGALGLTEPLLLSLESYRLPLACPRKHLRHFTHLDRPREVSANVATSKSMSRTDARAPFNETVWLHPRFTIGTATRGEFEDHQRPFLAYWGTAAAPRHLRLRLLRDGVDFAAGLFFSTQHEGRALSVVTFRTDQDGPLKNGSFTARDLRLRLEFGGDLAGCTVKTVVTGDGTNLIVIQDEEVRFVVRPVSGKFGDATPRWSFPELSLAKHLDALLHTGASRTIDLPRLNEAFVCFAFEEWPYADRTLPAANIEARLNAGQLHARWVAGRKTLDLSAAVRPSTLAAMNDAFRSRVA